MACAPNIDGTPFIGECCGQILSPCPGSIATISAVFGSAEFAGTVTRALEITAELQAIIVAEPFISGRRIAFSWTGGAWVRAAESDQPNRCPDKSAIAGSDLADTPFGWKVSISKIRVLCDVSLCVGESQHRNFFYQDGFSGVRGPITITLLGPGIHDFIPVGNQSPAEQDSIAGNELIFANVRGSLSAGFLTC
jgi:hypothetical protein